ncbi:hypothetical protein T492DRAFT_1051555 [Pavlovales sp. CCMP2436]|nr:hypothetical protein T492DRAFT_1051555 [Pavlovales sp. CCMP2436]
MVQQVFSVTGLVDVRLRSSDPPKPSCTSTHTKGCKCVRPGPTPRLGRASAAAALPWRPQGAASSS